MGARSRTGHRESIAVAIATLALVAWPAATLPLAELRELRWALLHAAAVALAAGLLYAPIQRARGRAGGLAVVGLLVGLPGAGSALALGRDGGLTLLSLVLVWRAWERLRRPTVPQGLDAVRLGLAVALACAAGPAGLAAALLFAGWMAHRARRGVRPLRVWFAFAAPALLAIASLQAWSFWGAGPEGPVDAALASALEGRESATGMLRALGEFPWPGSGSIAGGSDGASAPAGAAIALWAGWGAALAALLFFGRATREALETFGGGSLALLAAVVCVAGYVLHPAATPQVLAALLLALATLFGGVIGGTHAAWPLATAAIAAAIARSAGLFAV